MTTTIAIANDHAGTDVKNAIVSYLENFDYTVINLGTDGSDSVDYPDYADKLADTLKSGDAEFGILLCGTGIGISIAVNRHRHIRGALCHGVAEATLCREHNNANVLVLGARNTDTETIMNCVSAFLNTNFEGGRHQNRLDKIS